VVLRLRFADYTRATRSHTMAEATAHTPVLLAAASDLLTRARPMIERRGLTCLGVALTNLADREAVQLALPFQRAGELDTALDGIRDRFGSAAITRAALVGRDPGIAVPLLPD
jgi:DNA polymerase-4